MDAPSFHEFKRKASFFFKEKIKIARLAFTDVTPAQLLAEEAIDGYSLTVDIRTIRFISRAVFEVDDYWRIVDILHTRLWKYDKKQWQCSYKALLVVEGLLTHGPKRVAEEFQYDKVIISEMGSLKYVDEKGFNWGLCVQKKSERLLKLLEDEAFLKEERDKTRKITSGIKGLGSFCQRSSSVDANSKDSTFTYVRCNSHYNTSKDKEDDYLERVESIQESRGTYNSMPENPKRRSNYGLSPRHGYIIEDHPFSKYENQIREPLISI